MIQLLYPDYESFNGYFHNKIFNKYPNIKESVFIVYEDKEYGKDLIFTRNGICSLINGKKLSFTKYEDVKLKGNNLILRNELNWLTRKYCNPNKESKEIMDFIQAIRFPCSFQCNSECNCEKHSVYIENVDKDNLGEWFRKSDTINCKNDDVTRIVMYSTKDILEGYHRQEYEGLISKHHLFQFVCSNEDCSLCDYRVVEFKNIETNLQEQLNKKGYIKYQ